MVYDDPSLGAWLSQDPLEVGNRYAYVNGDPVNGAVGEPMFMNGYSYANSNPVNLVDPTGLIAEEDLNVINEVDPCQINLPANGCTAAPYGNQGEIEALYTATSGIALTVACDFDPNTNQSWSDDRKRDVGQAIQAVQRRLDILGLNYQTSSIFRRLEFRIVRSGTDGHLN